MIEMLKYKKKKLVFARQLKKVKKLWKKAIKYDTDALAICCFAMNEVGIPQTEEDKAMLKKYIDKYEEIYAEFSKENIEKYKKYL